MEFNSWSGAGPIGPLFNLSTVENPFQAPSSYGAAFDETAPPGPGTYGFAGNNAAQSPAVVHIHKIKIDDPAIREGCPVAFEINEDLSINPELIRLDLYPEKTKKADGTLGDNIVLGGKQHYKRAMRLRNDPAEMGGDGDIALMAKNLRDNYSAGVLMSKEHISDKGTDKMYRVVIAIEHFVSVDPTFVDDSFKIAGSSCVCVLAK